MSLGTLSLVPGELLEYISDFLDLEYEEWLAARLVSREFLSWIRGVRVPSGRILRYPFLQAFPQLRRVVGPLLISSLEEVTAASSQLQGSLEVWFPAALNFRQGSDCRDFCLVGEIQKGLQFSTLSLTCLQVLRERAKRYPTSRILIRISRLLYLQWERNEGVLFLPTYTLPDYSIYRTMREGKMEMGEGLEEQRSPLREALESFFREVPLTHLTYLELVVMEKTGHALPSLESGISCYLPNLKTLRSLGDTFQYDTLPRPLPSLPLVTELRFRTFESRMYKFRTFESRMYNGAPYGWNIPDVGHCLVRERYGELEKQVQEITGGYLVFGPCMVSLPSLLALPSRFPQVRTWKLLLQLSEDVGVQENPVIYPFSVSNAGELEETLKIIPDYPPQGHLEHAEIVRAIRRFRVFWDRWGGERNLDLYYLR